jgi:hypothetical protein
MFCWARDVLDENSGLSSLRLNPQLHLITAQNGDPRRYNLPTVNHELAAVIPNIPSEFGQQSHQDVILYLHYASDQSAGSPVDGRTKHGYY